MQGKWLHVCPVQSILVCTLARRMCYNSSLLCTPCCKSCSLTSRVSTRLCVLCLCKPLCPFLCSANYVEMSGVCSVVKKFPLVLWIIEMQITPPSIWQSHPKTHVLTLALLRYKYLSIIFYRVNFSSWGLLSIQAGIRAYLIDGGTWIHNCFLILRHTPRSRASFFSTLSHMEMGKPDTGGRVIIQLGGEPGSQGKQYMSCVYSRSRNEHHIGKKHMLVSLQD